MEKERINIEDFHSELVEEVKAYSEEDWYRLFLVLFLNSSNEKLDNIYDNISTSLKDAFAISSIKKIHEDGETHKRLWK